MDGIGTTLNSDTTDPDITHGHKELFGSTAVFLGKR